MSNLFAVLQMQLHTHVLSMVRELDPLSWTMCSALALSPGFGTVPTVVLVVITVPILRMLVQVVKFSVSDRATYVHTHPNDNVLHVGCCPCYICLCTQDCKVLKIGKMFE